MKSTNDLTNWEIVLYALYLLGGVTKRIHTEEIVLKAYELAPDLFSWENYPDRPDKYIVRLRLWYAMQDKNGALVVGRAGVGTGKKVDAPQADGWQFTEAGAEWIKLNQERVESQFGIRKPKGDRQKLLKKMDKIRKHSMFKEFKENPKEFSPTRGKFADFLRCRVDAEMVVWDHRISTLIKEAIQADMNDVQEFLKLCRKSIDSDKGVKS